MISAVEGTVTRLEEKAAQLKTAGGVSYSVFCSNATLAKLVPGQSVELRVHMQMREDGIKLYGFLSGEELRAFDLLIKVQGISGHLALAALSVFPPEQLGSYLATEQSDFLSQVPGIGGKLAKRVTTELAAAAKRGEFGVAANGGEVLPSAHRDVFSALTKLGFAPSEVRRAMGEAVSAGAKGEVEELLASALRALEDGNKQ